MKTGDAVVYFGNKTKLANALGIGRSAVSQWGEDVPELRAFQIERLTGGKLTAMPSQHRSDADSACIAA